MHLRDARIYENIYLHDGILESEDNLFRNKVAAERRCATRIKHLLLKLHHKKLIKKYEKHL